MDDAAATGEGGAKAGQKDGSGEAEGAAAVAPPPPPPQTTKGVGCPYSSLVAHRALFGPHRRRARKAGDAKAAPSRLSRVSTAEDGTS